MGRKYLPSIESCSFLSCGFCSPPPTGQGSTTQAALPPAVVAEAQQWEEAHSELSFEGSFGDSFLSPCEITPRMPVVLLELEEKLGAPKPTVPAPPESSKPSE